MVRSGLDVLIADQSQMLQGKRIGLVTHAAAIDRNLRSSIDAIGKVPQSRLVRLFGPEHGLHGQAQDLIGVCDQEAQGVQTRVMSLYGKTFASLKPTPEQLQDLDLLIIDMQDVGSRFYTFQATMKYCMEVALPMGIAVMVLDRPNPLGGLQIEGPTIQPGYESFVGVYPMAVRHGLTIGELARLYFQEIQQVHSGRTIGDFHVIRCEGWTRSMYFDQCELPWVLPSPNMPTLDTAIVYPGQCLLEGTNLSEGRGTTRPFEICGAPWIDSVQLAKSMQGLELPGVVFRPVWFRPTFHKHAEVDCGGVQIHVLDRQTYRPVQTSLALLIELRKQSPERFAWRTETYEFVSEPIAIDLLFGSSRERLAIEAGESWQDIARAWCADQEAFAAESRQFWLYNEYGPSEV
ncbi:MAG: exo-beta-N-acetylmuramidase NamZ domain-containing protein [Pirellula sp.]